MATLTIIKDDKWVNVDGVGLNLDSVDLAANVHAVQWNGSSGWIEYNDGTPNKTISSIDAYSTITDNHATKKAANETAATQEAEALTAQKATYSYKREQEYPSIADQLDNIYHNGVDGWKTTIKAVKDKYPK